ncbi:MAG: T9SS type A sorting domain-containing protein [Bacteroidetes bacterium]|nr:T9SS type A sorting domain-containing protein [Bacteroidota bacterium]
MKTAFLIFSSIFLTILTTGFVSASTLIPADNPNIHYVGRWDFTMPSAPSHSWPGVYLTANFEGTSIGVSMTDNYCYYNVFIDGVLMKIFHPDQAGKTDYNLVSGLTDGNHTLMLIKRNEASWTKYTFNGLILDDGKTLLPPPELPVRKIEFVGDSFTSASGNEATTQDAPSDVAPVTNITEGFGPITAKHFDAQYHMTSQSGFGMVMDYTGSYVGNIPDKFDQTQMFTANPPWDFEQWIPNLVVIGLGLNDYSGFGGYSHAVSDIHKAEYKNKYHEFIGTIRDAYPGVRVLAVAPHVLWLQQTIAEIVEEENAAGRADVFYTDYPYYDGGYVNNGHPNVASHHKIADRLIAEIESIPDVWTPFSDLTPPTITKYPDAPFTVYDHQVTLAVQTDSYSTVKYSNTDKSFKEMEHTFSVTGERKHSVLLPCEHATTYNWYIRASDVNGNETPASLHIQYTVDTTKVVVNWKDFLFGESAWKSGATPISSTGVGTTVMNPVQTAYFRKKFTVENLASLIGFRLLVKGNDGFVVYLNGEEVNRTNMIAEGEITYSTSALKTQVLNTSVVFSAANGLLSKFRNGENQLSVEVHGTTGVTAISFDSQVLDNVNKKYISLGSDWFFSDSGSEPAIQLAEKPTGIEESTGAVLDFRLFPAYPNPFNPSTEISWFQPASGNVSVKVHDLLGREIATLSDGFYQKGVNKMTFNAAGLSAGLYIYSVTFSGRKETGKVLLLK